jgi:hypothetical protein
MVTKRAAGILLSVVSVLASCASDEEPGESGAGSGPGMEAGTNGVVERDAHAQGADASAAGSDAASNGRNDAAARDALTPSSDASGASSDGASESQGVDAASITLRAIGANGSVGLDWPRVAGATGYRVSFATTPGAARESGQVLEAREPGLVHRALTNGTAYYYVVRALLASGEGPASPEASATPSGEWVLEQLGSGDFDDVVSGKRVTQLPLEKRVQVLLLPEGYLAAELGTFHGEETHAAGNNDVDRWVNEVFAVEPYSRLKEAFVVWVLPRASTAHAGEGDTAFDVMVANAGVSNASGAAAALFGAIDAQGSDAFPWALTQTNNVVAAFLIYDPARRRAGFSGISTGLRNPANNMQTIRAALGVGHAHEFTHAFAGVSDEYMELNNMPPRAGQFSNVAPTNRCDELPWAHLLEGRGINTTPGLVGAFGRAEHGFHSELYCMMNGTHENGQFWCEMSDERYTSLTLRPNMNRLCNICREITAYRVFERTGLLTGSGGLDTWKASHRPAFFMRFGFSVPEGAIPQTLMCSRNGPAKPVFEACVP